MATIEERVSRLEGESQMFQQSVDARLNSIDGRLNTLTVGIFANFAATVTVIIGVAAILLTK